MFTHLKTIITLGYDEDTNVIVLSTVGGVFMLQLDSMKIKRVYKGAGICYDNFHPYKNFYTAGNASYTFTSYGKIILFFFAD